MSSFIINVGSTIFNLVPDAGFAYTDRLNDVNEANIRISGQSRVRAALIVQGAPVEILRNGTREFYGIIDKMTPLEGGGSTFHASGFEIWLAKEKGTYTNSPWKATASATIFTDIIGDSTHWALGSAATGINIDFRAALTTSIWSGTKNLISKTGQDISLDYSNLPAGTPTLSIVNTKGSTTSIATLNDKIQIRNLKYTTCLPIGNDVRVYGKGDGSDQIKSALTSGQDATSKSTYGTITRVITDRSVMSVAEANILANAEVAVTKDPTELYDFEVVNTGMTVVSGDVVDITSPAKFLGTKTVRVVEVMRGMRNGIEFLDLKVANSGYSKRLKSRNRVLAEIQAGQIKDITYMEGTSNVLTFSGMINAKNDAGLNLVFSIPESFMFDEAGNRRISSFTLDYDVDKYRRDVGTASEDSIAPDFDTGVSATASHKHDATDTGGHTHNVSANTSSANTLRTTFVSSFSREVSSGVANGISAIGAPVIPGTHDFAFVAVQFETTGSTGSGTITYRVRNSSAETILTGSYGASGNSWVWGTAPITDASINVSEGEQLDFDVTALNPGATVNRVTMTVTLEKDHTHSISAITGGAESAQANIGDSNKTPVVDGATETHDHNVSVGDGGINDASSINATEVNIYIYKWAGTFWDLKFSTGGTGKTIDTDVDITNSDVYPDTSGMWRVTIYTNSAKPDLVKGIVKIKHQLDNV